MTKTEGYY